MHLTSLVCSQCPKCIVFMLIANAVAGVDKARERGTSLPGNDKEN